MANTNQNPQSVEAVGAADGYYPAGSSAQTYTDFRNNLEAIMDQVEASAKNSQYGICSYYNWLVYPNAVLTSYSMEVKTNWAQYLDDINQLQEAASKLYKDINDILSKDPDQINNADAGNFAQDFDNLYQIFIKIDQHGNNTPQVTANDPTGQDAVGHMFEYFTDADTQSNYLNIVEDVAGNLNAISSLVVKDDNGNANGPTLGESINVAVQNGGYNPSLTAQLSQLAKTHEAWVQYNANPSADDAVKPAAPDDLEAMSSGGLTVSAQGADPYFYLMGPSGDTTADGSRSYQAELSGSGMDDLSNTVLPTQSSNTQNILNQYSTTINQLNNINAQSLDQLNKLGTQLVANEKMQ